MDTALGNGDFALGSNGRLKQISGTKELLQRAAIRLNVPLGSFAYDVAFGSRLHALREDDPNYMGKALAAAQEALLPLSAVTVEEVHCPEPGVLTVQVTCQGESMEIEVKRNEQL